MEKFLFNTIYIILIIISGVFLTFSVLNGNIVGIIINLATAIICTRSLDVGK